jgi:hypothetical protein
MALLAPPSPYGFETKRRSLLKLDEYNLLTAARIAGFVGSQSITLSAFKRPFWRSPIFTVPILKDGASAKPLEELPITPSTCARNEK